MKKLKNYMKDKRYKIREYKKSDRLVISTSDINKCVGALKNYITKGGYLNYSEIRIIKIGKK